MQRDGKWLDNFQVKANIRNLLILLAPVPAASSSGLLRGVRRADPALATTTRKIACPTRLYCLWLVVFLASRLFFVKGSKEEKV